MTDTAAEMTVTMGEIRELVGLQLGVRDVGADDDLAADLGAESMDVVNIVTALEDRYEIEIEEEELSRLKTVRDLHRCVVGLV